VPILIALGVLLLGAAVVVFTRYVQRDTRGRDPDRLVLVTALAAVGCTVLAIALQLGVRPDSDLRPVLTAGIVAGGVVTTVFALWLNHRRYRLEEARQKIEQSRVDLDRGRHLLDQERAELERARERREDTMVVVEGLAKAVEAIGNPEPRVRAAALHRLAGLAAHRPDRAQEVVDLVCLYLRTAAEVPDPVAGEAQRVLLRIVQRANLAPAPVLDLEVDLAGARLSAFTFGHVCVRALLLTGAHLSGVTSLHKLRLTDQDFGESLAHRVDLDRAVFEDEVWLSNARLRRLSARGARFRQNLLMEGALVANDVVLADSSVAGDADFGHAALGSLNCNSAVFDGIVRLARPGERGDVAFLQTRFGQAHFEQLSCGHRVVLDGAHVEDALWLPPRGQVPNVSLRRTTLGPSVVSGEHFRPPPGWRVRQGTRDETRYLEVEA